MVKKKRQLVQYFAILNKGFPGDFSLDMNKENKYYQVPVSEMPCLNDSKTEEPF